MHTHMHLKMEVDDGLTAVIHQASERELPKEREREREIERERERERGKLVERQRKVHWNWLGYVVVDVAIVFTDLDIW